MALPSPSLRRLSRPHRTALGAGEEVWARRGRQRGRAAMVGTQKGRLFFLSTAELTRLYPVYISSTSNHAA
jgi:hypothetical protein